ncbi:hypothetical protein K505DRAFT_356969 [Melanomma pulvis-pyrius CBS 109.77]|uniref:Uncharacterized protein n=1 Tax=Melanomma pulvis-pyrius CBS 109.77 TaxID=1314802 RepID=A0A6A6XST5_9PLEO|nr:hypothetical protein K505DRAFT_356969 [Melanomma pulvis-pyrius CBS 109.77]
MVCRDYPDSCVVDYEGTCHTIAQLMPAARTVCQHLENDSFGADEKEHEKARLNGLTVQFFNLESIHAFLYYCETIHDVKVDDEDKYDAEDNPKRKTEGVHAPLK